MIEERILKKLEDAEHATWDAYILIRDSKNKYKEYSERVERAWVELTVVVEKMRKEYRKLLGLKEE